MSKFITAKIKSKFVSPRKLSLAVDTTLSMDGTFPDPGPGDYLVTIHCKGKGGHTVLVSRRYTRAVNDQEAADLALNAFADVNKIPTDKNGLPLDPDLADVVEVDQLV
jgi:hypothetical protein